MVVICTHLFLLFSCELFNLLLLLLLLLLLFLFNFSLLYRVVLLRYICWVECARHFTCAHTHASCFVDGTVMVDRSSSTSLHYKLNTGYSPMVNGWVKHFKWDAVGFILRTHPPPHISLHPCKAWLTHIHGVWLSSRSLFAMMALVRAFIFALLDECREAYGSVWCVMRNMRVWWCTGEVAAAILGADPIDVVHRCLPNDSCGL